MIAVLGTSVIGYFVDQFLLAPGAMEPAKASASAPKPQTPAAPAVRPAAVTASAAAPGSAKPAGAPVAAATAMQVSLAERLKSLALKDRDPTEMREAFAPSRAWLASLEVEKPPAAEPERDVTVDFISQHKLTSVLRRGNAGSAIVDGKFVEIGEHVDGYRLIGLTSDGAIFRSPRTSKEVRLLIIGPAKQANKGLE
ncbi:MAG: hypothetical protein NT049_09090 [Planctomycetota bacterium]|nr:hypothetical protein [Planctomycetota bacterium]